MKQKKIDFTAFGLTIKAARKARGISRNILANAIDISPRYIANIENSGQHPSLQALYALTTFLDVSVDTFFFPDKETGKPTQRRQLDTLLDGVSGKRLRIVTDTPKEVKEVETEGSLPPTAQLNSD